MDIDMSIASLSTELSGANILQDVGVSVMKKAMSVQETEGANLEKMMSAASGIGRNIDISL